MKIKTGEPRLASVASWAVLGASFGLSAATWIALAQLAGFGGSASLPLVVATPTVRLEWLMPIAVDGYLVVALVLWLSPVPARVARFARTNTYGAAFVGITAQSAYHALTIHQQVPEQLWRAWLAAVVGALPPAVAALAVHMRALIRREATQPAAEATQPAAEATQPAAEATQPAAEATQPARLTDERIAEVIKPYVTASSAAGVQPIQRELVRLVESHTGFGVGQRRVWRIAKEIDNASSSPNRVNGSEPVLTK